MELKPGYKQTEVGVIPEDWEVKPLRDLNLDISDGNYSSKYPKASDFRRFGVPFIRANNIQNMTVVDDDMRFISKEQHRELQKGHLKANDILITTRGEIGQLALVPESHIDSNINAQLVRINTGMTGIDYRFLAYSITSGNAKEQLNNLETGSALKQLPVGRLVLLRLALPSPSEQKAIAQVLADTDALLDTLNQLIAKKRDLKQAAMQQLLTDKTHLPGFCDEWEVKTLGEISEITMGQSPSSSNYNVNGDGLPLIQGNADIKNRKTIKRIFTTQITKKGKTGDVLLSVRAPVGEVSRAAFDICLGRGVCAIRYSNDFIYHHLVYLEPTWSKHSKGSTFDSVNSSDVKALEIYLPSDPNEQIAIAQVLADMDDELRVLEQRRVKTRDLKQGMMQELLTGKTRLVAAGELHA